MGKLLRGEIRPTAVLHTLPLLSVPQTQGTAQSPMREIMARRVEMENDPRVITASVVVGYPYADVARAGMSVLVTTNGEQPLAQRYARELGEMIWAQRSAFEVTNMPVVAAVMQDAITSAEVPVILVDVADNIGGGAPGDGTVLLQALLSGKAQAAVVTIADPEAVAMAIEAGTGQIRHTRCRRQDRFDARGTRLRFTELCG